MKKTELIDETLKVSNPVKFLFVRGNIQFDEIEEGKVQCGICKKLFARIVSHLNNNEECCKDFDLDEFKASWLKFRNGKKDAKYIQKQKKNNQEQFLTNQAAT